MMDVNDANSNSLGNSDNSNDAPSSKSINLQLDGLRLNSSLDSCKSEDEEKISRGKPILNKSNSANQCYQKNKTSKFVLQLIHPDDSNKSSGYSSSISPTSDIPISTINSFEKSSNIATVPPIFEEIPHFHHMSHPLSNGQSTRKLLQKIIAERLFKKKPKIDLDQWIFDFGDTNLIKTCRRGQVSGVQECINELLENQKYGLINHQNMAKETALSIATYQMNEVLINILLRYGASPQLHHNMKNNVLHLAADMTIDMERKTFNYLIEGIKMHQPENLWLTLTSKNIFNYDPINILKLHRDSNINDHFIYNRLQHQINQAQSIINTLCTHFSMI